MAEAAVTYVLCKLADALQSKAHQLHDVSKQINQMQLELSSINAYLKDADSKRKVNESVKEWVNQVRDMAYRIEDAIDTFLAKTEENRPESSHLLGKVSTVVKKPYKVYKMCKLEGELKEIIQNLNGIYKRRENLEIKVLGARSEENGSLTYRRTKHSDVDDSEVVGLKDDKCKIINQLLDRSISRRTVLSIVGVGGLGKTTLAQKVYKSEELERQFDCLTWLSISQKFNINDLLREIIYSIQPEMKNENTSMRDEDLAEMLKRSLGCKRYLVILDDVWKTDLWEELKNTIPDENNASRVIITTRLLDVANAADRNTKPYELRYLSDDESLALLFRKAFQQHIQPQHYPPDLVKVGQKLIKKCDGLPLALVVLGGILSRRERRYTAWSKLEQTMDWYSEDGKKCSQVLAMSYEDLPYYLKPCFLYFASFPEDYQISGKHVTRMWMAEGFIPKSGAGTIDDRAEEFLLELVQRCLIQVTEKSWNGSIKYCSMHDLLRDLAMREAKEENFFTVFSKEEEDVNQLAARKPRRAALQFCTLTNHDVHSENTRTLLCFGFGQYSSKDCCFRLLNYSGFSLLRVLTIERVDMRTFASGVWLKGLVHLRYLGFRYCTIGIKTFKNNSFYNLETIDLKGTSIYIACHRNEIIDRFRTFHVHDVIIPTLRHVYGCPKLEQVFPLKWDHLANLRTLKRLGHREVHRLGYNINLHTLGISYLGGTTNESDFSPQREWETLEGVLRRMEQLVSLRMAVYCPGFFLPFRGTRGLPCHEKIQSLHLYGEWGRHICLPSVEIFPTNLIKLTLERSRLEEDPMPIFERLQSLRILRLRPCSYEGTKLICSTGGFPNLEKLELENLTKLYHWDIKDGAMPILSHLKIDQCRELHALPELQKLQKLQELLVNLPSSELRERMQREDLSKIKHIPYVHITR